MFSTSLNNKNNVKINKVNKRNLIASVSENSVMVWQIDGKLLHELKGRRNTVTCVCFHPDKTMIASVSSDGSVRIWDVSSGKCLIVFLDHDDWVSSVSWSPDGRRLASTSFDESIRVYDTSSDDLKEWRCIRDLQGHSSYVCGVAWSMDSSTVASASWDKTVRVWNIDSKSGECSHTIQSRFAFVNCVSFSPDGKYLASGSNDKTVRIYDTKNYGCINTLQSTKSVDCISWSPDSRLLAYNGPNNEVWMVEVKSPSRTTIVAKLEGHTEWPTCVDWNDDGTRLVSGSGDKTVRVWDVKKKECIKVFTGHSNWVRSVAWRSPSDYYNYEKKKRFLLAVESAWNSC